MKAQKLPSGNWRARAYSHTENGKQKVVSFTAPTRAEAIRLAVAFMDNKGDPVNRSLTVSQCIEKYIASKENVLSPGTIREYTRCYKSGVYDSIGDIKVEKLTSPQLQAYVSDISKGKAQKTVKNIYGLLSASISMFSDKTFRVTLPAKKPYEYHVPISEDINALIEKADTDLKLCILLASIGTLRRGEICGLQYKDVLYDKSSVYVHSDIVMDKNGEWVRKEIPKTSSSIRIVKLPENVMEFIGHGEPEEYLYKRTPDTITWRFRDLRESLGMKCRFHDLRHYAASIMHAIGVPDQYIMEKGGWKSDSVLKSVYRNTLSDLSEAYQKSTDDFFSKNINI